VVCDDTGISDVTWITDDTEVADMVVSGYKGC
jgi:hypothetical protein